MITAGSEIRASLVFRIFHLLAIETERRPGSEEKYVSWGFKNCVRWFELL